MIPLTIAGFLSLFMLRCGMEACMVAKQLGRFFEGEGYACIPSNLPEFTVFFQMENAYVNVFHLIDYRQDIFITAEQYLHIKEKIKDFFLEKGISQIHILSLIVCEDSGKAKWLCTEDAMSWMIDSRENKLMVFEGQVSDFYGMRKKIECFLEHPEQQDGREEEGIEVSPRETGRREYRIPAVTAVLAAVNILVFFLGTFTGEKLFRLGAIGLSEFVDGQYYRILTSLFLHWDTNHLMSNMLILYFLGEVVEKYYGPVRYALLYAAAGIGGNLASMAYEFYSGASILSAGASGAIFGLIGALFVLVVSHKGHFEHISLRRLVFMVAYSLYSGLRSSDVNNAAHIGGLLSGAAIALIGQIAARIKKGKRVQDA